MKTLTISMCMAVEVEVPDYVNEEVLVDKWDITSDGEVMFHNKFQSHKFELVEAMVVDVVEDT